MILTGVGTAVGFGTGTPLGAAVVVGRLVGEQPMLPELPENISVVVTSSEMLQHNSGKGGVNEYQSGVRYGASPTLQAWDSHTKLTHKRTN